MVHLLRLNKNSSTFIDPCIFVYIQSLDFLSLKDLNDHGNSETLGAEGGGGCQTGWILLSLTTAALSVDYL